MESSAESNASGISPASLVTKDCCTFSFTPDGDNKTTLVSFLSATGEGVGVVAT